TGTGSRPRSAGVDEPIRGRSDCRQGCLRAAGRLRPTAASAGAGPDRSARRQRGRSSARIVPVGRCRSGRDRRSPAGCAPRYGCRVRVVVAPDKFKGTLSAEQAARAISVGFLRADPSAEVDALPMGDGGEGTLDALVAALGGERHRITVSGPLGDVVEAEYGVARTGDRPLGIVEMARASGLGL